MTAVESLLPQSEHAEKILRAWFERAGERKASLDTVDSMHWLSEIVVEGLHAVCGLPPGDRVFAWVGWVLAHTNVYPDDRFEELVETYTRKGGAP